MVRKSVVAFVAVSVFALTMAACASLRDQDVKSLRDVQSDLADRYGEADGGDRLVLKTDYCQVDAVLESAGHPSAANAPIRCK